MPQRNGPTLGRNCGSALMALPAEGVTLEEKQAVNKALSAVLTQDEQVTRWVRAAMEQAKQDVPFFILADGPAIFGDIDNNPALAETPWKLNNYGMSSADGQLWLESQFLF